MWPFKKRTVEFQTWPIVRTKPGGKTFGEAVRVFINNWQCHLTTIDVYADGAIDCWGFVDLALFRQKLASRWIVPGTKDTGQHLSVFNFGSSTAINAEWWQSAHSISTKVDEIIHRLNPTHNDLIDMHGDDTEVRGKVRCAKMGLSDKKVYKKIDHSDELILGDEVPILRRLDSGYELTPMFVFADGLVRIGPEGDFLDVSQIQGLHDRGEIQCSAPKGSKIMISGLGKFCCKEDFGFVPISARIGEIYDKIEELNGRPSIVRLCAEAYDSYEQDRSRERLEVLRELYERVPDHLRCYCGDMDTRDSLIIQALYGSDAIER